VRRLIKPTQHTAEMHPRRWWKKSPEGVARDVDLGRPPARLVGPAGPTGSPCGSRLLSNVPEPSLILMARDFFVIKFRDFYVLETLFYASLE